LLLSSALEARELWNAMAGNFDGTGGTLECGGPWPALLSNADRPMRHCRRGGPWLVRPKAVRCPQPPDRFWLPGPPLSEKQAQYSPRASSDGPPQPPSEELWALNDRRVVVRPAEL
jgi:hypothetical protein